MTLEERLAEERVVFLWGEINPNTAGGLIMRLLELQAKSPDREIHLYINSPGGSVDDTLAIYDTMQYLNPDVATYCVGQAASGAAMILAAGAKGKRFALPHSKVMIHQPWGGVTGQASDIQIQAEEILKAKKLLNETRKPFKEGGYRVSTMVLKGEPAEEILLAASTLNPELIVLGAKGLTGIERFLLGSVAQRVARFSPYSVLIVKQRLSSRRRPSAGSQARKRSR